MNEVKTFLLPILFKNIRFRIFTTLSNLLETLKAKKKQTDLLFEIYYQHLTGRYWFRLVYHFKFLLIPKLATLCHASRQH